MGKGQGSLVFSIWPLALAKEDAEFQYELAHASSPQIEIVNECVVKTISLLTSTPSII